MSEQKAEMIVLHKFTDQITAMRCSERLSQENIENVIKHDSLALHQPLLGEYLLLVPRGDQEKALGIVKKILDIQNSPLSETSETTEAYNPPLMKFSTKVARIIVIIFLGSFLISLILRLLQRFAPGILS